MMRLAKITNSLLLLALPAAFAVGAAAQEHPNVQPSQVKSQLAQAAPPAQSQGQPPAGKPSQPPPPSKSPSTAKSPVKSPAPPNANPQGATKAPMKSPAPAKTTPPASKTATQHPPTKAEAKAPQKPPSKAPAAAESKPPAKAPAKTEAKAKEKKPVERPIELAKIARRDPFESLLAKQQSAGGAAPANLPQGKPGLIVGTLRIDGIVKSTNGMIAIVSNPQQRVYFLRDGDKLYDGSVDRISMEGVSFHEQGKDAFGKPIEREVTKQLYPSSGEPQ